MPLVEPTSSETTISTSASDRLTRSPAKIFGVAAGSTTPKTQCARGMRNDRAVSTLTWSTERTPSTVFSRIGHITPKTITAICICAPMPSNTRKTGTSTGGGMARMNAISGPT